MSALFSLDAPCQNFLVAFNPDMDNFGTALPLEPKIKSEVIDEPQDVCTNLAVQTTSAVTPTIKTEIEDCPTLEENNSNLG